MPKSKPYYHIALPWVPTLPNPAHSARTQAWTYDDRGLPTDVLAETVVPTPSLPPPVELAKSVGINEPWLLVAVKYAGLNPATIFQMALTPRMMRQARCVPEMDFAGEVLDYWSPGAHAAEAAQGAREWMVKAPEAPPSPRPYPPSTAKEASEAAADSWADAPAWPESRSGSMPTATGADDGKSGTNDGERKPEGSQQGQQVQVNGDMWTRGDRVAGMLPAHFVLPSGTGALQAIIAVPARYCVRVPANVTTKEAAGLLMAGMTADAMVRQSGVLDFDPAAHPLLTNAKAKSKSKLKPSKAKPSPRDAAEVGPDAEEMQPLLPRDANGANGAPDVRPIRILINAAGGGVGHLLLQMLKTCGKRTHITAICSSSKFDLVRSLGADEVIDYTLHLDLASHLGTFQPFDFAFDCLGKQRLYTRCALYLAPHGVYETVGVRPPGYTLADFFRAIVAMKANEYWPTSRWLLGTGRKYKGVSMLRIGREDRQRVMDLLAQGRIKVAIDSTWSWTQVREAYKRLMEGHAAGKIVVEINPRSGSGVWHTKDLKAIDMRGVGKPDPRVF